MKFSKPYAICTLAALTSLASIPGKADVPTPPATPPVPAGYCTTINNELNSDLNAFNLVLAVPPVWSPINNAPTLYGANLQTADASTGPQINGSSYLPTVLNELQELKATGITAVSVPVGFPVLYSPFIGASELQSYENFYANVAAAVRAAGLTLIVNNEVLLSNSVESGWANHSPTPDAYYASLTWPEYMAGRATMAATIATVMKPDYLIVAEEPDTEANTSGQQNMNNPTDAAQMIQGEITAVQALNLAKPPKMGAGFGTWMGAFPPSGLAEYIAAYIALPLDYIDIHIFPVNTEAGISLIANSLVVASSAAAVGKPIAIGQAWNWKMENTEWTVLNGNDYRARDPFSFWAPLDQSFLQTMQKLSNYAGMIYTIPEGPNYLFSYQTYNGTVANGGAANCTCTLESGSCVDSNILHEEDSLANAANQVTTFTSTGIAWANDLINPPDTTAPSTPPVPVLGGSVGFTEANFTWTASTDNVGVAGYNVLRCSPATLGGACTGVQIASQNGTSYLDSTLASNTFYNYQVQAFDLANNNSKLSPVLAIQTLRTSSASPTGLTATAVSPTEINLSWTAPSDTNGLTSYQIFSGTTPTGLTKIITLPSTDTTYSNRGLSPATMYFYGVEAVESGINSAMSSLANATTLPAPDPPSGLTATASSPTEIVLAWTPDLVKNGLPLSSYQVFQGTDPGHLVKIATVKVPGETYTARSLTGATQYYFAVAAVDNANDNSGPSDPVAATTLPEPPAPTNLTLTAPSATTIDASWSWSALPGGLKIARYQVNCGTSPSALASCGTATTTTFTYRTATAATPYYFDVVAIDSGNDDSVPSAVKTVTTPPEPAAPTNVKAVANSATKVTVTWTETIPQNGLAIKSYTIFRGTSPTTLTQLATRTTPTLIDTTVTGGNTYYYAVEATDTGGDVSPKSAPPVSVTTP